MRSLSIENLSESANLTKTEMAALDLLIAKLEEDGVACDDPQVLSMTIGTCYCSSKGTGCTDCIVTVEQESVTDIKNAKKASLTELLAIRERFR